jgi:hypothetical protein
MQGHHVCSLPHGHEGEHVYLPPFAETTRALLDSGLLDRAKSEKPEDP